RDRRRHAPVLPRRVRPRHPHQRGGGPAARAAHGGSRGAPVADCRGPERRHEEARGVGGHHRGAHHGRRHLRDELQVHAGAGMAFRLSARHGGHRRRPRDPLRPLQALWLGLALPAVTVRVRREPLVSSVARALISALNEELSRQYPEPGSTHFRLDTEEVSDGRGAFVVAWVDGSPLGCGAVRRLDPTTAELKRMYVAPGARGGGVGRALLEELEREARRLGARQLLLETGVRQRAALVLYERAGFVVVPAFGEYRDSPLSVCMAKDLTAVHVRV